MLFLVGSLGLLPNGIAIVFFETELGGVLEVREFFFAEGFAPLLPDVPLGLLPRGLDGLLVELPLFCLGAGLLPDFAALEELEADMFKGFAILLPPALLGLLEGAEERGRPIPVEPDGLFEGVVFPRFRDDLFATTLESPELKLVFIGLSFKKSPLYCKTYTHIITKFT